MTTKIEILEEKKIPGRRLGRHVEHDPRSRGFSVTASMPDLGGGLRPLLPVSRAWKYFGPIFDQGELGACTGYAAAAVLNTEPFCTSKQNATINGDVVAKALYAAATRLDRIRGVYPPEDTGSTGLAVAKAMAARGWISSYRHAFSLSSVLRSLSFVGPGLLGIRWYEGFDQPKGPYAELVIDGDVRGGHELAVTWIDVDKALVGGPQSWGPSWGNEGCWSMSFDTLGRLLDHQGDFVAPILEARHA